MFKRKYPKDIIFEIVDLSKRPSSWLKNYYERLLNFKRKENYQIESFIPATTGTGNPSNKASIARHKLYIATMWYEMKNLVY